MDARRNAHTFVIVNPAAGQDETRRLTRRIGAAFTAHDAPFDLALTEYAGHASVLAQKAAEQGYSTVCVAGGDGTLAEVANGLVGTSTTIGLIPRGTANQVARNLRIPLRVEAAVRVIVTGVPMPIDLGSANGRAFTLVAGAGFDAVVMGATTRPLKERFGFAAYILAAMKEALGYAPARFWIRADDRAFEIEAVSVMMANAGALFSAYLPLRFPLGPKPEAAWQDGLLELVVVAPRGVVGVADMMLRAASGRFSGEVPPLLHLQAREIEIRSEPVMPFQLDGDLAGETPVLARAVPRAAAILVPSNQ